MDDREFKDALYEQFARIGHALSTPKRLEILALRGQGERSVEVLAREAALSVANASQHLRVLRSARLVDARREGPYVYYRLGGAGVWRLWAAPGVLAEAPRRRLHPPGGAGGSTGGAPTRARHRGLLPGAVLRARGPGRRDLAPARLRGAPPAGRLSRVAGRGRARGGWGRGTKGQALKLGTNSSPMEVAQETERFAS